VEGGVVSDVWMVWDGEYAVVACMTEELAKQGEVTGA